MMLHRHFEDEKKRNENTTTLRDVTPQAKFVSEVFPPEEENEETAKRRGRPKKSEE